MVENVGELDGVDLVRSTLTVMDSIESKLMVMILIWFRCTRVERFCHAWIELGSLHRIETLGLIVCSLEPKLMLRVLMWSNLLV